MTRIVFLDTETTGVHPDRRVWEIGMIARDDHDDAATPRTEREYHAFVDLDGLDLGNADRRALDIGRFYQRHPQMAGTKPIRVTDEVTMLQWVEEITRDAVLVGVNVQFDAEALAARMRFWGMLPAWRYSLVEVNSLAVGYLFSNAGSGPGGVRPGPPPWRSDTVTEWLGLDPVDEAERHTALGDARHVMRVYDKVTAEPTFDPWAGRYAADARGNCLACGEKIGARAGKGCGPCYAYRQLVTDPAAYDAAGGDWPAELQDDHAAGRHDAYPHPDCAGCTLAAGARRADAAADTGPADQGQNH